MSKQRLGKRERMARKRINSFRKTGHLTVITRCSVCSEPGTWKFGPSKADKIAHDTKMVCGQCRSCIKSRTGVPVVGT